MKNIQKISRNWHSSGYSAEYFWKIMFVFKFPPNRIWHRCGESCSTGSSLPMDCDPYAPAPPGGATSTDDNGGYRRSDSLAPEIRGGSLPSAATGGGGRSSMSSQTSQPPPGLVLPPKLPHSSLVTLASRLVPESSNSPGLGNKASSSGRKERYLKAKVNILNSHSAQKLKTSAITKSTKIHFLPFQKWQKINFLHKKKV